jgi:hypothetical protein
MALGMSAFSKMCLGIPDWQVDADAAIAVAAEIEPQDHVAAIMWKYVLAIPFGALAADATALADTAEALRIAEQSGDDFTLGLARLTHGFTKIEHGARDEGLALLVQARDSASSQRFIGLALAIVDPEIARQKARLGDLDGAIKLGRTVVEDDYASGDMIWLWLGATALVEALVARGTENDLFEAQSAIDRLAAVPTDPGFILHELTLLRLRGLLARAQGDKAGHDEFMAQLRAKALALGFEPLAAREF